MGLILLRRSTLRCLGVALPLLGVLAGCADGERTEGTLAEMQADGVKVFGDAAPARVGRAQLAAVAAEAPADAAADGPALPTKSATAGRKIISHASVDLVTEDLPKLEAALRQLVSTSGAYVADSNRTGSAGATRSGSWKIRVPVDNFDTLLRGVSGLGELVSTRSDTEDVSAEFFDLEARQTAKKVEEARLLKHLSDSTGRLEEILAVERELSRVRSEIERMQGRLAVLTNQTSLGTITVSASEIRGYIPPNPPTLAQKVGRTFGGSVGNLARFGEGLLLGGVALAPWLPLIVVVGVVAYFALRWPARLLRAWWQEQANAYRAAVAARSARG